MAISILEGLHDDARGTLGLTVAGLEVSGIPYKESALRAEIGAGGLDASLRVASDDGFAEAHSTLGARWGSAMIPSIDKSRPADLSLKAKQFRVGLFAPLVAGTLGELDGHVTADVRLHVDPGAGAIRPEGIATLQDGALEVVALGGEFHDVSATATFTPDGVVRLNDVSARGLSGRLEAAATARFDGLGFGGLRAKLQVPQKEPLPVVFDDVQVGTFYGSLGVSADRSADRHGLDVNVDVQALHVQLPLSAAHEVQALGNIEGLRVGTHGSSGFVEASHATAESAQATAMPVRVAIDLGNEVEVKRGATLDIVLAGRPTLDIDGHIRAAGQIRLVRGTIDVQGKKFALDSGTVTFVGDDPTNPQVALTAKWSAPDGTLVYADFVGPLKTGKVSLRSEPSRSNNEIIALILFGTADDSTSIGSGAAGASVVGGAAGGAASIGSGAAAASVVGGAAGGAATQPINRMLDDFGLAGGITTKIDTSTSTPRPEVEVRIARDITLQVAWVLGVPPPGSNPNLTLVTLNWRFLRKWSLQTTVGDAGTSIVDLIWQHRY